MHLNNSLNTLKANNSDTGAPLLDLHISITNEIALSNIYDTPDDIKYIFLFWLATFLAVRDNIYSEYISQLITIMLRTSTREINV